MTNHKKLMDVTYHKKLIDVTASLDRDCLSLAKEKAGILKVDQSAKMP